MTFKTKDMIRMWHDQLCMYQCLHNAYNWQVDNEDYIFIRSQIDKLNKLIDDNKDKTDKQFTEDMQEIFSKNIKTVRQSREHSIISLTKNLERDEFNYLCNHIKTFKMPSIQEDARPKRSMFQKIIDFIKAPVICRHGIIETQEYCPLCFGYKNGAVKPTSSLPPLGIKNIKPAPQKK